MLCFHKSKKILYLNSFIYLCQLGFINLIHIQLLLDDDFKLSHACSLPGAMSDSLVVNPALHMDQLAQEPPHLAGVKLEGHQGRMVVRGTSPGNRVDHSCVKRPGPAWSDVDNTSSLVHARLSTPCQGLLRQQSYYAI